MFSKSTYVQVALEDVWEIIEKTIERNKDAGGFYSINSALDKLSSDIYLELEKYKEEL